MFCFSDLLQQGMYSAFQVLLRGGVGGGEDEECIGDVADALGGKGGEVCCSFVTSCSDTVDGCCCCCCCDDDPVPP